MKDALSNIQIPENNLMLSFDVKNLFTSIPIDFAMAAITEAVTANDSILQTTNLSKEDIIDLTKICLLSNYFQYNQEMYKQISGTPMGSPISVVVAEITM